MHALRRAVNEAPCSRPCVEQLTDVWALGGDYTARRGTALIERGPKHYWRNGRGVMFNDTNLHDAATESNEVRVVLWLDVARKFPCVLPLSNRALLSALYREPSIRRFRENAVVRLRGTADVQV